MKTGKDGAKTKSKKQKRSSDVKTRSIKLTLSEGVINQLGQNLMTKKFCGTIYGIQDELVIQILEGFNRKGKDTEVKLALRVEREKECPKKKRSKSKP